MTPDETKIQHLKVALMIAFGTYFMLWSCLTVWLLSNIMNVCLRISN